MAKNIKGITIAIGGDTSELAKALKASENQAINLQKELKQINSNLKFDSSNATLLSQKMDILQTSLQNATEKLKNLESAQEQVSAAFKKGDISEETYRAFQREIEKTKNDIASFEKQLQKTIQQQNEFEKAMAGIEQKAKSLQAELKKVEESLKLDPTNTELLSQKFNLLQQSVNNTSEKLQLLKSRQDEVNESFKRGEISEEQYRSFQREIINTESQLKNLNKQLKDAETRNSALSQSFAKAGSTMSEVGGKIQAVGNSIADVGQSLTTKITLPFTALVAVVGKLGAEFEAQMSKVQAISGATGSDMGKLTELAKNMGAATKFSATEAAQGLEYMAMAGWKTEQMIAGLPGILNLAAASGSELGVVSDIVTDALTGFGLSAKDSADFADILAAASSNANTNVEMMGETFKYVAPVAGALGYSAEDTALAVGLMANAGIKASQAGTSLRGILTRLAKPTDEVAEAMATLGIEFENQDGTIKPLNDLMGQLRTSLNTLTDSEKAFYAATLFGTNALSGGLAIVNATDEEYNKLAASINNAEGSTARMAATMEDNLLGRITVLQSSLEDVGLTVYNIMLPAFETVVGKIQEAVNWFSSLDSETQKNIVTFGAVAAAIGPILLIGGKIIAGIGSAISLVGSLSTAIAGSSVAMAAFSIAISPVGIAIAAVTAAIGLLLIKANEMSEENKKLITDSEKLVSSGNELVATYEAQRQAHEDSISSIEQQTIVAGKLSDEIMELAKNENKSVAEKALMQKKIDELNRIVPTLALAYDEEKQSLTMTNEEILKNVKAQEAQLKLNAEIQEQTNLRQEMVRIEVELADIFEKRLDIEKQLTEAENLSYEERKKLNKQSEELKTTEEALQATYEESQEQYKKLDESIKNNAAAVEEASGIKIQSEEEYAESLREQEEEMRKMEEAFDSYAEHTLNAFSKISQGVGQTASEMANNLEHNQKVVEDWSNNLEVLSDRGVNQGLIETLRNAGPESAKTVKNLVNASDEELARLDDVFLNGSKVATDAMLKQFGLYEVTNAGSEMIDKNAEGIENNPALENAAKDSVIDAENAMSNQVSLSDFFGIGYDIVRGTARGITSGQSLAVSAAREVGRATSNALRQELKVQSPSRVAMEIGGYFTEGAAIGIRKETPLVENQIKNLASEFDLTPYLERANATMYELNRVSSRFSNDNPSNYNSVSDDGFSENQNTGFSSATIPITLQLDGKTIAEIVSKHQLNMNIQNSRGYGLV